MDVWMDEQMNVHASPHICIDSYIQFIHGYRTLGGQMVKKELDRNSRGCWDDSA